MSKKSGPAPPPPPDPTVVAAAQSAANIASATAQQKLNMVGTKGPNGTVSYVADDTQPGGYTQTTTLSPDQQRIYDAGNSAQYGALGIANDQLGRVSSALDTGLDPSGVQSTFAPGGPLASSYDSGGNIQRSFDKGDALQYGFNPGQQVQGHVGPQDLTGAYQAAANASYGQAASRLDPQWDQSQKRAETQLANQGLAQDSDAYKNAMAEFNRNKSDAYNQANFSSQAAGLNAENTIFGQGVQQGQFANQAAGQQYAQNQGQAAFHNQTAGQDYGQNLGAMTAANAAQAQQNQQNQQAAAFHNTTSGQQFAQNQSAAQFANQANNQQFQQNAYAQNLPINEFNALMSSSQVGTPQGINYTPSQVGQTDVLGSYALNSQVANQAYQAQVGQQNALLGGLAQLGGAAIQAAPFMSDIRLKRDVELLDREADGLGVYRYRYLWDDPEEPARVGVIAQEVLALRPRAVMETPSGFLAVDPRAL